MGFPGSNLSECKNDAPGVEMSESERAGSELHLPHVV